MESQNAKNKQQNYFKKRGKAFLLQNKSFKQFGSLLLVYMLKKKRAKRWKNIVLQKSSKRLR